MIVILLIEGEDEEVEEDEDGEEDKDELFFLFLFFDVSSKSEPEDKPFNGLFLLFFVTVETSWEPLKDTETEEIEVLGEALLRLLYLVVI
tara:strand:+ start:308 stop:577 length:270 start_codon:yes stop_codon:yes gene_type:complete